MRDDKKEKTTTDLVEALEKLLSAESCELRREKRLTTSLNDDFVRAWLGQYGIKKEELIDLLPTKCRAATVQEVLTYLRQMHQKAA